MEVTRDNRREYALAARGSLHRRGTEDSFISCVPNEDEWYGCLKPMPGTDLQQIVLEKPQGYENLNYAENQYDIDLQLKDMDAAGIDVGILRVPCWQEWLSLEQCRQVNDKLHALLNRHPSRFRALAVVPPWGTPSALRRPNDA